MTEPIFKATFCNTKNVLGRKVMQIILEVPIEHSMVVHDTLGWPDPAAPQWVAVAPLKDK